MPARIFERGDCAVRFAIQNHLDVANRLGCELATNFVVPARHVPTVQRKHSVLHPLPRSAPAARQGKSGATLREVDEGGVSLELACPDPRG